MSAFVTTVERYSTIGLISGGSGSVFVALLQHQPLTLPLVIGSVSGLLAGGIYGAIRGRNAR